MGAGNMAAAHRRAAGPARGRAGAPEAMLFADAGSGRAAALAEEVGRRGGRLELAELADGADAGRPRGQAGRARARSREQLGRRGARGRSRCSAATPARAASRGCSRASPVVRVMPNLAVEVRAGRALPRAARARRRRAGARLLDLLGVLGDLVELPDELIDAATAIDGLRAGLPRAGRRGAGRGRRRGGPRPRAGLELVRRDDRRHGRAAAPLRPDHRARARSPRRAAAPRPGSRRSRSAGSRRRLRGAAVAAPRWSGCARDAALRAIDAATTSPTTSRRCSSSTSS